MIKLVPCRIEGDIRKGICKVSRTQQHVILALFIVTIVTIIMIIFYLKEHYLRASPITSKYVMELDGKIDFSVEKQAVHKGHGAEKSKI